MGGSDAAEVRGDFDELSAVRVEFPRGDLDFPPRRHGGFQDCLAGFLIRYLQPWQIGKEGRRGIARVDGEAVAVVERPAIATEVRHVITAAVVQIDGEQNAIMLGAEFEDELLLALNADHAVRIPENVGAEADFQVVLEPIWFGLVWETRCLGFS